MGTNKALLEVGGRTIVARTVELLRPLTDDLFIVADDPLPYAGLGLRVVPDLLPGRGSLVGIFTAIARAGHPFVLCVACDMPFLEPCVLRAVIDAVRPGDEAVIPLPAGGPEPLLAVYGRSLLPVVERALAAGELRVMGALGAARVRFLDAKELERLAPGSRSFVNINTPAELAAARRAAGKVRP